MLAAVRSEAQSDHGIKPTFDSPPHLSGEIDAIWNAAAVITDFKQREPFEGTAPTEKTAISIAYDRHNLYFGIYCYDRDPKGIVAKELRATLINLFVFEVAFLGWLGIAIAGSIDGERV